MEKLTLENIAPYLPYRLKVDSPDKQVYELTAWPYAGRNLTYIQEFFENEDKPILRHMDLTKPIQVEGKEIIPIVELASLVIPHVTWELHKGSDRVINEVGRGFCYDKPTKSFQYWEYYDWLNVPNQLALFQWLFKHKFDVFNLIERGLAIDVNTLETNPYQ